jgi:hypothetical protein
LIALRNTITNSNSCCKDSLEKAKEFQTLSSESCFLFVDRTQENGSKKHLLKLLHREALHSLRGRLRLENARLLGEGVDALASASGGLVLNDEAGHTGDHELAPVFLRSINEQETTF